MLVGSVELRLSLVEPRKPERVPRETDLARMKSTIDQMSPLKTLSAKC